MIEAQTSGTECEHCGRNDEFDPLLAGQMLTLMSNHRRTSLELRAKYGLDNDDCNGAWDELAMREDTLSKLIPALLYALHRPRDVSEATLRRLRQERHDLRCTMAVFPGEVSAGWEEHQDKCRRWAGIRVVETEVVERWKSYGPTSDD